MLTQIYEVQSATEAEAISALGVDHIGVLVGDGTFPRELSVTSALAIKRAVAAPSKLSALFLTADTGRIVQMTRELQPPILHLGASPDLLAVADIRRLRDALPGVKIMRSVPVTGAESEAMANACDGVVDFILLDSHRPGDTQIGALGITHDWTISRRIVERCRTPVILAGGLGPANVADAIREVRPAGVDSKTKTDKAGTHRKDLALVAAFHAAARAVERA